MNLIFLNCRTFAPGNDFEQAILAIADKVEAVYIRSLVKNKLVDSQKLEEHVEKQKTTAKPTKMKLTIKAKPPVASKTTRTPASREQDTPSAISLQEEKEEFKESPFTAPRSISIPQPQPQARATPAEGATPTPSTKTPRSVKIRLKTTATPSSKKIITPVPPSSVLSTSEQFTNSKATAPSVPIPAAPPTATVPPPKPEPTQPPAPAPAPTPEVEDDVVIYDDDVGAEEEQHSYAPKTQSVIAQARGTVAAKGNRKRVASKKVAGKKARGGKAARGKGKGARSEASVIDTKPRHPPWVKGMRKAVLAVRRAVSREKNDKGMWGNDHRILAVLSYADETLDNVSP